MARVNCNLGRSASNAYYYAGALAEAAIYGYALSPAQVAAHYAAGSVAAPPAPPPPAPPPPPSWTYIGCFVDSYTRAVPNYLGAVTSVVSCELLAAVRFLFALGGCISYSDFACLWNAIGPPD